MLDEYSYGQTERISPEAPVPVILQQYTNTLPGGAGNVVRNLHALGAQVYVTGVVGDDAGGQQMRDLLQALGLGAKQLGIVTVPARPTTRKMRIIVERQQVCRLDQELNAPLAAKELQAVQDYIQKNIMECSVVIFSDYDKGLILPQLIRETVALAKKNKHCLIAVDPQVTHFEMYQNVDVLTPNHHEAGRYLQRKLEDDIATIEAAGREILQRLNARMVLLTRGAKGMSLFRQDMPRGVHFPTQAREVFDVTGAGDTVISIFTLALAAGATYNDAVALANAGAGYVVGHIGTATVNVSELLASVERK